MFRLVSSNEERTANLSTFFGSCSTTANYLYRRCLGIEYGDL